MTARLILTLKFIIIWAYSFALSPIAKAVIQMSEQRRPPEAIFWLFIAMTFMPEVIAIVSKDFRLWIKSGVENSDNKMNHKDLKDLVVHYASLTSLRVFVLMSLMMMFYDVVIPFQYYLVPFFGSIGLSGFAIFKNMIQK